MPIDESSPLCPDDNSPPGVSRASSFQLPLLWSPFQSLSCDECFRFLSALDEQFDHGIDRTQQWIKMVLPIRYNLHHVYNIMSNGNITI